MKVSAPPDSIETDGALTPFASRSSMGACRLSLANAAHAQTPAQPRTAIITLRFIPSPLPWPRNGRRCASGLRGMDRHSGGNESASLESGINAIDGTHTPYVVRVRGRHEPLRNRSPPRLRLTTFLAQPSGPNRADPPR